MRAESHHFCPYVLVEKPDAPASRKTWAEWGLAPVWGLAADPHSANAALGVLMHMYSRSGLLKSKCTVKSKLPEMREVVVCVDHGRY